MQIPMYIYDHCGQFVMVLGCFWILIGLGGEGRGIAGNLIVGVSGFRRKPLAVNIAHTWNKKTIACVLL